MQMQRFFHEHAIRDHPDYKPENIRILPQLSKIDSKPRASLRYSLLGSWPGKVCVGLLSRQVADRVLAANARMSVLWHAAACEIM